MNQSQYYKIWKVYTSQISDRDNGRNLNSIETIESSSRVETLDLPSESERIVS